jgi:xylan 1,4-beta-xylosidase
VGRRQQDFEMTASCEVDFEPQAGNEEAGLSVFLTARHHYDLAVTVRDGRRCAALKKAVGDMQMEYPPLELEPGPATLSATCDGLMYTFFVQQGDAKAQTIGYGLARLVSPEAATINSFGTWTGVYLALYATGNGEACAAPADFGWFRYSLEGR